MARGPQPQDACLFAEDQHASLRAAMSDLAWLLSRAYVMNSSLKLVGDRHGLNGRQREALQRGTCSDLQLAEREAKKVEAASLVGEELWIDGFNLLILVESAMGGGLVVRGRDGLCRDLASVHGSYRRVAHTHEAIRLIGQVLAKLGLGQVVWLLDRPVSNSGRLAGWLREAAQEADWAWRVETVDNPDRDLAESQMVVASSDAWVVENSRAYVDLAGQVLAEQVPQAWVLDLGLCG